MYWVDIQAHPNRAEQGSGFLGDMGALVQLIYVVMGLVFGVVPAVVMRRMNARPAVGALLVSPMALFVALTVPLRDTTGGRDPGSETLNRPWAVALFVAFTVAGAAIAHAVQRTSPPRD